MGVSLLQLQFKKSDVVGKILTVALGNDWTGLRTALGRPHL